MGNRRICGEYIIYLYIHIYLPEVCFEFTLGNSGATTVTLLCSSRRGGSTKHVGTEDQLCVSLDGEFRV